MSRRAAGRHRRDADDDREAVDRYGKDRLYVSTEDSQRVGWLDLLSGESTVELPEFSDAFQEAVSGQHDGLAGVHQGPLQKPSTRWSRPNDPRAGSLAGSTTNAPGSGAHRDRDPRLTDLAVNRPGQAVRTEAESLLADMKSASKFKLSSRGLWI